MNFHAKIINSKVNFKTDYNRNRYYDAVKKNEGADVIIDILANDEKESRKQRGLFEGAVIPLFAYLDGHDYRDWQVIKDIRENFVKPEFNGEYRTYHGETKKVGKSTKGKLNEVCDKFIDWLEVNYGIVREKHLNPLKYKKWRDETNVMSEKGWDTYIDYMIEMHELPEDLIRR